MRCALLCVERESLYHILTMNEISSVLSRMFNFLRRPRRIYLDHAAATPLSPAVRRAMMPYFKAEYGNPSSIHHEGVIARHAVEEARTSVARTLRVRATDVTFTSGGTEANNLALRGTVARLRSEGIAYCDIEIIALRTEHPSISETLTHLAALGCVVRYVGVREDGLVDMEQFSEALSPRTRLVTIAYANSETGVVQDLARIGRTIRKFETQEGTSIVFHTDASQAPLWLSCALEQLHVDLMTLDAGKFQGPKGVGALIHRPRGELTATTFGGSQEAGLRPGTENVSLVVGFAVALAAAQATWKERGERVRAVRDYGCSLLIAVPHVLVNGSLEERLPSNINISIPGFDTEYAVITLDAAGISCSTKSACSGAGSGISTVVFEMTGDTARAGATMRFTLGEETSMRDMERVVEVLKAHLAQMQEFRTEN